MYLIFIFLLLFGCKLGPPYSTPEVEIPEKWKTEQTCNQQTSCLENWWEIFQDDTLNDLEEQAIKYNPNLYAALERVFQARAIAGVVGADLYPQATLNPSYTSTGQLFKIFLPGVPGGQTLFQNIPNIFRIHQMQYVLPLNLSYEIDLWGRLRSQYDSAKFNAEAEEDAYYTSLLTLTTDLANYYFQLRSFMTQQQLYENTLKSRRKALELTERRFKSGLITYLDVAQASLELTNTESQYYDIVRQKNLQENQIAVLIGAPASCFMLEAKPLTKAPPCIPSGIPSTILLKRPDIAQAERTMASEHALIGAAYASFFPSLNLTGALGFLSPDLKHFLTWKSRYWQVGVNASETIFDGWRNCSNLALSYSRYREAADLYKQQVLVAFREVEDALNNLEMQAKQAESLERSVASAKTSFQLTEDRYIKGAGTYLDVVETERLKLDAERNFVNLLGVRYLSTVQLIKALGGCW